MEGLCRFALGHAGDARKGETLFFENQAIACARCHAAAGRGPTALGPDLSGVGRKYDKAALIRSVLDAPARIGAAHRTIQNSVYALSPLELTDLLTYLESLKN
jgi:cytochrome c553